MSKLGDDVTKSDDVSDDKLLDDSGLLNKSMTEEEDGKEIDAWEKALQEKKRLKQVQEEEKPNANEESLITISDDDDF